VPECQLEGKYGECCCTCRYQVETRDDDTASLALAGYGCAVAFSVYGERIVYLTKNRHGLCELHEPIEKKGSENGQ